METLWTAPHRVRRIPAKPSGSGSAASPLHCKPHLGPFLSRQLYENAISAAGEARADVQAQAAALRSAQIDLGRTIIRAPISGRIGRSLYTTGALVKAGQDNPLTTIQRLDPIYVDIQQS